MAVDPIIDCVIALVIDADLREKYYAADAEERKTLLAQKNPDFGRLPKEIVDAFVAGNSRGVATFFAAKNSTQTSSKKKAGIGKKIERLVD